MVIFQLSVFFWWWMMLLEKVARCDEKWAGWLGLQRGGGGGGGSLLLTLGWRNTVILFKVKFLSHMVVQKSFVEMKEMYGNVFAEWHFFFLMNAQPLSYNKTSDLRLMLALQQAVCSGCGRPYWVLAWCLFLALLKSQHRAAVKRCCCFSVWCHKYNCRWALTVVIETWSGRN